MKEFIQLLLLLTPTWASARLSPAHKKERKKFLYILLFLPCKALSKTVKTKKKVKIIFVIMILFVLFSSWEQQIRFYNGGILNIKLLVIVIRGLWKDTELKSENEDFHSKIKMTSETERKQTQMQETGSAMLALNMDFGRVLVTLNFGEYEYIKHILFSLNLNSLRSVFNCSYH